MCWNIVQWSSMSVLNQKLVFQKSSSPSSGAMWHWHQLCHCWIKNMCFRNLLHLHHWGQCDIGPEDGNNRYLWNIGFDSTLTWLITCKDFITFACCETYKCYIIECLFIIWEVFIVLLIILFMRNRMPTELQNITFIPQISYIFLYVI